MERDTDAWEYGSAMQISTHTLTWSVTIFFGTQMKQNFISTHTLTWSVTFEGVYTKFKTLDFNSHAHVERDANPRVTSIYNPISTHTLTWSVT